MMPKKPEIIWKENGTPEAAAFGDIYFSPEDGLAETSHVFLGGIGAPEVWRGHDVYTIGETGFGTGLNFLGAWDLFERTCDLGAKLHYISIEGFPLDRPDLERALEAFPSLRTKADDLAEAYPPRQNGFHRLSLGQGRVQLTLLFGDVVDMLRSADFEADAWFLDGFAPSCNPQMWSEDVFEGVAKNSAPGARLATFTVAGKVRRGLGHKGFDVKKVPGFGRKRDCLAGVLKRSQRNKSSAPWYAKSDVGVKPSQVAIIGAGIAGASLAATCLREGIQPHVFDRWGGHAEEGSGNPAAMMNPRMSLGKDADAEFGDQAYVHAMACYDKMEAGGAKIWKTRSGAFQIATDVRDEAHQARLIREGGLPQGWLQAVSAEEARKITGVQVPRGGLFVPHGGFLDPDRLCGKLLESATFHYESNVTHLVHRHEGWALYSDSELLMIAERVVLANAMGAIEFSQTDHIPFGPNRGQLTLVPASEATQNIQTAISYNGYISPAFEVEEGLTCHLVGATYDRPDRFDLDRASDIRTEDHERNLDALRKALGDDFSVSNGSNFRGRAAVRCTTTDRMPVVGPAPVAETYERLYYDVHHGRDKVYSRADYHDGLYIMAGFGSRGFQYAPLAAEILVADMLGLVQPVPEAVRQVIHPGRFLMRGLRRKTWAANGPGKK
jgi:tRNA 5-methylaminomethyl-2-thiouridine biosynthesis bifunctional protein